MLWPHIDAEYQQELEGIARGAQSKGIKLGCVGYRRAQRQYRELAVLLCSLAQQAASKPGMRKHRPDGHCSAFIATGSYTKGGKIVIAHNNWSSYADGERWTVMFDIQPSTGTAW